MRALAVLPESWQLRYRRWLDRRIPAHAAVTLNQRNLFIFLSRQGLHFLLLVALIWVGATNYQNNLAYALCFLLLSLLFVTILHTFANVSGLTVRFVDAEPVFAGDVAQFRFLLSSASAHQQLLLGWPGETERSVSLAAGDVQPVLLGHRTQRRGILHPARLRLSSEFPLGLMRCWTWLDLAAAVLVYPRPETADYREYCGDDGDESVEQLLSAGDEYFSLKPYVEGDPRSRIAWKHFAAGRGLMVREYAGWRGADIVLDLAVLPDVDMELRLSKLCYCALQLHAQDRYYGLRLGSQYIKPAQGEAHLRQVLTALALWKPG